MSARKFTDALTHLTHITGRALVAISFQDEINVGNGGSLREERQVRQVRQEPAADLDRLAHAVARLSPSHRDPERFHMDRSEIVAELRRLARELDYTK